MEMMEEDEPLSSSEAPRAPALDSVQGLSIPVAGPETPFRPTSGMPGLTPTGEHVTGGYGWRALGCAQCLRGRGEGAAASRPALQGFRRARRQRVGARAEEAGWVGVCLPGAGGGHRGAHCCCAGGMRHAGGVGEGRRRDAAGIRG